MARYNPTQSPEVAFVSIDLSAKGAGYITGSLTVLLNLPPATAAATRAATAAKASAAGPPAAAKATA